MRQVQKHAPSSVTHVGCHISWNLGVIALPPRMNDCTLCEGGLHKEDAQQMFAEQMNRFWIVCFVTRQHYGFLNWLWSLLRIPSPLPWNQSSCWSNASSYSHGHWQLGPSRSSTQLSKSLKIRFSQLLDDILYFYTMIAIPGWWLRASNKQSPN